MPKLRLFILSAFVALSVTVLALPKHEIRAVWITSAYGLDWPKSRANTPSGIARQKKELTDLLDLLQKAHFNTVLFQARTRGDVFYRSAIEPYSALLTGKSGKDPGYDPLAFAIEECHKRGMECHAWIVTIPLGNTKHVNSLGKNSVWRQHRNLCLHYKNEYFLNPGNPKTKEYLWSLVREMVGNYDLDGVHFDYFRYPERATNFPDNTDFRRYGKGRSLAQWRRDNLTDLMRYLYQGVKALKPWVKVSTSPVGKFDDTSRFSSRGWNAYSTVYQDVKAWLKEGIQDQIYPMMYFKNEQFYPFALDWAENSNQRHVVPGLGIYFLDPKEGNWQLNNVKHQLNFIQTNQLSGAAFYRTFYLEKNTQGLYDALCEEFYTTMALQPPMPWLDEEAPSAPKNLQATATSLGIVHLTWDEATDNDPHNKPRYVVYASNKGPTDTTSSENIVATYLDKTEFYQASICPWDRKMHFAVTAVDRYGNESEPAYISLEL